MKTPVAANKKYARHLGWHCPQAVKGSYVVFEATHVTCKACLKRIAERRET
jgi:hypothetical protein